MSAAEWVLNTAIRRPKLAWAATAGNRPSARIPCRRGPGCSSQSGFTTGAQYGQPKTGGQMSTQDSVTPPTGPNPWGPGAPPDWYPRPYNNPNRSTSGAPINNFPGLQQPRTGGEMTVDSGMPKPAMAPNQPMTGGNDVLAGGSTGAFNEACAQQLVVRTTSSRCRRRSRSSSRATCSRLKRRKLRRSHGSSRTRSFFARSRCRTRRSQRRHLRVARTSKLSIRGSTSSSLRASIKSGPIRSAPVARLTITCARSGITNRSDRGG
jgi:hypothetical protein